MMNDQTWMELEQMMNSSGDGLHAQKLKQLQQKYISGQLNIAFCGHFSAGKSSVINTLCEYRLLPSSPIPTSANIVSIRNGAPQVQVTHLNQSGAMGNPIAHISLDQLAEYCKDGKQIEAIAIQYPIAILDNLTQLLDTPGIDSTDGAHQMSTESALHLADVVFYVMDYNHVQSETNLAFTKRMKDWGKPVYLIVNQIDKHQDEQLSFAEFRKSVEDCFRDWQAEPDGILYTSLKQRNHPENDWNKLKWLISELINHKDELRVWSLHCSLRQIVRDHLDVIAASHEEEKELLRQQLPDQSSLAEQIKLRDEWIEQSKQLLEKSEQLYNKWHKEMTAIIDNANLTPAATRDLAHEYLGSRKPGFKVGLFSRAAQTAKEIESRLAVFQGDFAEKVNAHLSWHLIDYFKKEMEAQGLQASLLQSAIESISVEITSDWLADQVNPGAVFSNEYTLNFSKQVSNEVKAKFRKLSLSLIEQMRDAVELASKEQQTQFTDEIAGLDEQLVALKGLQSWEQQEQSYEAEIQTQLQKMDNLIGVMLPNLQNYKDSINNDPNFTLSSASWDETASNQSNALASQDNSMITQPVWERSSGLASQDHANRMKQTAKRLISAANFISDVSAMKILEKSMREKAKRLENNRFTISLFGAFSAGKSSFANALIGERILPVSPNPTTATINRIMPPTEEWPHGSVRVKMKSNAFIRKEILFSAEVIGLSQETAEEVLLTVGQLSSQQLSASGKPHHSFLKAAAIGWSEASPYLDQVLNIDLSGFASYVADESKSCFVERIDLYYDHPLTSQGIIFVDTPGADSINARHTGVAFNYIKNADAIVFVTYYNHAFSQADREFLLQLGRVKDTFELDKMFFIVNAADLAANEEERQLVIEHVKSNLLTHGIRHPRIYPVSSMEALEGKLNQNQTKVIHSGMQAFENDFIRFTLDELTAMAVRSSEHEIVKSMDVLEQRIVSAKQGEEERKQKLNALNASNIQVMEMLEQQRIMYDENETSQEIQELLYYVKQRISFRYGEFYNLAFNPSSLREDGRDVRKALKSAWNELIRLFSYDLSHELLASTLRIEHFIHGKIKKAYDRQIVRVGEAFADFQTESITPAENETPVIDEALEEHSLDEKWLFSYFKNGKHFFEGEGKAKLRIELESIINDLLQRYIQKHLQLLLSTYHQLTKEALFEAFGELIQAVNEHVEGQRDALEMKLDAEILQYKKNQLKLLLSVNE
jgi:GTPase Era involved in 16S rRNA processing